MVQQYKNAGQKIETSWFVTRLSSEFWVCRNTRTTIRNACYNSLLWKQYL